MRYKRMKKYFSFLLFLFLLFGCSNQNDNVKNAAFLDTMNISFDDIFSRVDSIVIKNSQSSYIKTLDIYKILKFKDKYLIISASNREILALDGSNNISIIARKGDGPGEVQLPADFLVNSQNNLFVLDARKNVVLFFDSNFVFQNNYLLSFAHRTPLSMLNINNDQFLIGAERNLGDGATSTNYKFIQFEDISYLNYYDKKFKLGKGILHPSKELLFTFGAFSRPDEGGLARVTTNGNYIYAILQDGIYRVNIFNKNGDFVNAVKISNKNFKRINIDKLKDFKLKNGRSNYSLEKTGKIIASFTKPISMINIGNSLIVQFKEPYSNYFPQFRDNDIFYYHIDLFKINKNELIPIATTYPNRMKIIGKYKDVIYFIKEKYEEQRKIIKIYKYKLKEKFE